MKLLTFVIVFLLSGTKVVGFEFNFLVLELRLVGRHEKSKAVRLECDAFLGKGSAQQERTAGEFRRSRC